jgi:hypothetical protein
LFILVPYNYYQLVNRFDKIKPITQN